MFSNVKGGGLGKQEKTVTAGTTAIEVTPDIGKSLVKVTIKPTPTEDKTVTPSTSQQIISPSDGKHLAKVIMEAMPSGALSDITVSTAGLITAQVGTPGYLASGTKKTKQLTTQAAKTWTPKTTDQSISSGRYLTGKQTIKGDANLLAANIKSGVSIFGVAGTLQPLDLSTIGISKLECGTITPTSNINIKNYEIQHNLGVKPKGFLMYREQYNNNNGQKYQYSLMKALLLPYTNDTGGSYSSKAMYELFYYMSNTTLTNIDTIVANGSENIINLFTDSKVTLPQPYYYSGNTGDLSTSTIYLTNGVTYKYMVWA